MNKFTVLISQKLDLPIHNIENTIKLFNNGCTVPFISRYRKEKTGGLDEVTIQRISSLYDELNNIAKRKDTIINTISGLGKLTQDLQKRINDCWNISELEDIYLPYKPKRKSRAQTARELGLEPLASLILKQTKCSVQIIAQPFIRNEIEDSDKAIKGALNIIAEKISENERARQTVRDIFRRTAIIKSTVFKLKRDTDEAIKYSDYYNYNESLKRCSSHRLLAIRRGEADGVLRVKIEADDDECIRKLRNLFVTSENECSKLVAEAVEDSYKRLIAPSIETEFAILSRERAENEAIDIFANNLRQLLLTAPLGQKNVMGIDPGFRSGCKVVCLDKQGNLLHNDTIYPHPPQSDLEDATFKVKHLANTYGIEAIAIGNGTASRETLQFIKGINFNHNIKPFMVSEDGASIYSASQTAREEFPDKDITVRGAISIGRRLMDPLAELVKINPKSIGIGLYQHDVNQKKLKKALDDVVVSCVNLVGVNLNTASKHLLSYVSGLNMTIANNIVDYRHKNGPFKSRKQLLCVPRLGKATYEQCAGFLRIPNAENPLDNTAVHPESYIIVEAMAKNENCNLSELINDKERIKNIDLQEYITSTIGIFTLEDIIKELVKPGLDPRTKIENFDFNPNVKTIHDLSIGLTLPGIITNITNFGAFVDIGIHQDGLLHISQMSKSFISDPTKFLKLHQHVIVRVINIDLKRNRISLSMLL